MKGLFQFCIALLIVSCNSVSVNNWTPEKLVGSWKIIDVNSDGGKAYDHSMDDIVCELEKYKNTNETYVFHLFTGNELLLTQDAPNHMKGENANMDVTYNDTLDQIVLSIPTKSSWTFKRLK